MSYLEKIADMVDEADEIAAGSMLENEHVKIAMLDDAAADLADIAEYYGSEDLMKVAEVIDAMVAEEAADVDDTMNKLASMVEAGPATAGLIEKRASEDFEENMYDEAERISLLDEISDFVKEAAIDVDDGYLYDIGDTVGDIADYDADALTEIAKEAGMLGDAGSWLGEKARAFGHGIASGASARDIRESYGKTRDIMKKPLKFLDSDARKALIKKRQKAVDAAEKKLYEARHLPSGKRGQKIIAQNRANLRSALWQGTKGLGKTSLVYGLPAGAVGYGAYQYGKSRR